MKVVKILLISILFFLSSYLIQADGGPIYLPIINKGDRCILMTDPVLRISDGNTTIDLLGPGSGWELSDPYWQPQISQFKGGGSYSDSGLATGKTLVHKEYDNVIETIPLSVTGIDQGAAIQTIRDLMQLGRQASDYWAESYEYDDVWLEIKPACANSLTGYARLLKMSIPELHNPFGQPFFSAYNEAVMEDITLLVEREPFWRAVPPGEIIGPLYNLIKNPDFELWNFGVGDSQPDSWTDLETLWVTGDNSRDDRPQWGRYTLKVHVGTSTQAGAVKGVVQTLADIKDGFEYTILAWVRSEGVTNGVGRILVNYSSQLELYRDNEAHGWQLYTGKITTGTNDVVSINCEILTTGANTDGTVYFDGLMFIEGDWIEEAENNLLPYMSGSHIVNHWDQLGSGLVEAGDINFVDVWNIPGDVDSLIRLEVMNNTTPSDDTDVVEVIKKIRVGMRRANDVFDFTNYNNVGDTNDITASGDERLETIPLSQDWQTVETYIISSPDHVENNMGRFRVLARIQDTRATTPNLDTRLQYFVGSRSVVKDLDAVRALIRGNWTVVDLTPTRAMIQDLKLSTSDLGQIGYYVQMKRDAGTDIGYLDYVLTMPTDGGFIEIDFDDVVFPGSYIIVDNTHSTAINMITKGGNWVKLLEITECSRVWDFLEYKGSLYFTGAGDVFKLHNTNKYSLVFTVATSADTMSSSLAKYRGKLIVGTQRVIGGGVYNIELYSTVDGTSWTLEKLLNTTLSLGRVEDMIVFKDKLYVMEYTGSATRIYSYDGINSTLLLNIVTAATSTFEIYQNRLYTTVNNDLRVLNEATNNWDIVLNLGFETNSLKEYKDEVYFKSAGVGIDDYMHKFDGQLASIAGNILPTGHVNVVIDQEVYNDKLFGGGTISAVSTSNMISTRDGIDWSNIGLSAFSILALYNLDGTLYAGASNPGGRGIVYVYTDAPSVYSVANYKGGTFTAPPRKRDDERRHRYFFSYDRENFINDIDDKALIGIGFVPRYLSLINKELVVLGD